MRSTSAVFPQIYFRCFLCDSALINVRFGFRNTAAVGFELLPGLIKMLCSIWFGPVGTTEHHTVCLHSLGSDSVVLRNDCRNKTEKYVYSVLRCSRLRFASPDRNQLVHVHLIDGFGPSDSEIQLWFSNPRSIQARSGAIRGAGWQAINTRYLHASKNTVLWRVQVKDCLTSA